MMVLLWTLLSLCVVWFGHAGVVYWWQRKHPSASVPWLEWLLPRPLFFAVTAAREVTEDFPCRFRCGRAEFFIYDEWMEVVWERYDTAEYYLAPLGWKASVTRIAYVATERFWRLLDLTRRGYHVLLNPIYVVTVKDGQVVKRVTALEYRIRQWFAHKES